jgi:flagellar M-ring protein FliF
VLRPLLRKHLIPSATGVASRAQTRASVPDEEVDEEEEEEESPAEKPARLRAAERQKANVGYAHQSADKDPRLVATLIQHWMGRS